MNETANIREMQESKFWGIYLKKKKKRGGMGEVREWWWYSHDRANEINSPKHKANLVPQKMKCELHTTYIQQLHGSTDSTLF